MTVTTLQKLVEPILNAAKVPGAALTFVSDDGKVQTVCFGIRKIGEESPVTDSTRFAIASVSKAFTAAAVASAIDDGKMTWDDPVRKHLPAFRLLDPAADASVTIRDLLCHRTGLPRHDGLWYRSNLERTEILRRIAFLKPSATFRGAYQYNNLCFAVAGEAVAAAVGKSYEDYLREKLLLPLGMDVTFSGQNLSPADAAPHRTIKDEMKPIEPLDFFNVGPAGAMNVNPADMGKWIRHQLSPTDALAETHRPQMVVPLDDQTRRLYPDRIQQSYALGWSLYDWQGQPVLSHGGSIDGFRSHLVLLPRQKIGFSILINLGKDGVVEQVRNTLLDRLLNGPRRSWLRLYREEAKREKANKKPAEKLPKIKPSLALSEYAGTYSEPGYGDVEIGFADEKLVLSWLGNAAPLKHKSRDLFVCDTDNLALQNKEILFQLDGAGKPKTLSFVDQTFVKNKNTGG